MFAPVRGNSGRFCWFLQAWSSSHLHSVQTGTGASLCTTVDFKHSPISGAQTNNISNFYDTFIGWKCLAVNSRTPPHAALVQLLPVCGSLPSVLVFKRKQVQHLTCLKREQASLADQSAPSSAMFGEARLYKTYTEQNNKHVSWVQH